MGVYVGIFEGNLDVDGFTISGEPIHIICKPHLDSDGKSVRFVNFPINPSLLEITDNFSPAEHYKGLFASKSYKDVLADIFHRQRVKDPVIALFQKSELSLGCFLCSNCTLDRVYVARSSDKYVLDHITRLGRDFVEEI
jgi:hypothetical protein